MSIIKHRPNRGKAETTRNHHIHYHGTLLTDSSEQTGPVFSHLLYVPSFLFLQRFLKPSFKLQEKKIINLLITKYELIHKFLYRHEMTLVIHITLKNMNINKFSSLFLMIYSDKFFSVSNDL